MDIYTIRVLSEDGEILDYQETIADDDNDAQITFLETVENMEDVYRRTPDAGGMSVQLYVNNDAVIREVYIG